MQPYLLLSYEPLIELNPIMHDKNPQLDTLLNAIDDAKAFDVTVIDVSKHTSITDYMIICTGRSSRHVKAIAAQTMELMKTAGVPAMHDSGIETGEWALVDFGDFIIHIMQADTRAFYNIEGLWQERTQ